jgi:hypothetical protein
LHIWHPRFLHATLTQAEIWDWHNFLTLKADNEAKARKRRK